MAETSAGFKILQEYHEAFSADGFSFSAKNVAYMWSVFSAGFDTSISFYSELWISLSHKNFWEICLMKIILRNWLKWSYF